MGRLKADGDLFYLGRVRVQQWRHSENLRAFLTRFCAVGQNEKLEMLEQLIKGGGYSPALLNEPNGEDAATTEFLDNFLL